MQPMDSTDSARLTALGPGFRHSWLTFGQSLPPDRPGPPFSMKNVAISMLFVQQGECRARSTCQGREVNSDGRLGTVRFHPADGLEHVTVGSAGSHGMRFSSLIIPPWHLTALAESEGLARLSEPGMRLWQSDTVLQQCLLTLTAACSAEDAVDAVDAEDRDEAARTLLFRLAELMDGGRPDWHQDMSVFNHRVLEQLVDFIDAHLAQAPSTDRLAAMCGLSPSHFARKFRQSTGVSLQRFVNRRRLQASLQLLRRGGMPLSRIALELGFSSQSHFTRLFSELTGMTPARYRRMHGPARG